MGNQNLPNSIRIIINLLTIQGPMTIIELSNVTRISPKSITYAINKLQKLDKIEKQHNLEDMRSVYYRLHPDTFFTTNSDMDDPF